MHVRAFLDQSIRFMERLALWDRIAPSAAALSGTYVKPSGSVSCTVTFVAETAVGFEQMPVELFLLKPAGSPKARRPAADHQVLCFHHGYAALFVAMWSPQSICELISRRAPLL